ncbi:MAG: hypothetical protein JETT_1652 [Candidatus Jettenia ecosi]|uniref:Uncharacterized protein n=1 Tax=Candidatus Jettenia ecosi TaxID=2494326 RepID=A0A533QBJ4_9BACT|nr:MAG: hypothetical protein JETT_1652 [Candidatus Jettenia ecosi]
MNDNSKQISNSASTGGLGPHFENRVQTVFSILMLAGGFSPCLPTWPIVKIKFQGKYQDFETDDLIVYCKEPNTGKQAKLIGQIKHSVKITKGNEKFGEAMQAAWQDFNNAKVFSAASKDAIVLICGPLSAMDTNSVRPLLEQAKYSENAEDFIKRIERAIFTSNEQRKKLDVFRSHLQKANNNIELTDEELWRFLKSFHLLIYDLDTKGVTLSLLHTLIEQYSCNNANALWTQIYEHVQWVSENAGYITISSIPEEISSAFKRVPIEVIPADFVKDTTKIIIKDWNYHPNAPELAITSIIGSWNENIAPDKAIISQLAKEEYSNWIFKLRDVLQQPESPLALKNGIWSVKDRQILWQTLGTRIFDDNLDIFKKCVVTVLTERDPKFELPKEDRFAASMYGKVLKYSNQLRKGLAESLSLLGCYPTVLTNCSFKKAESVAALAVREIFNDADWILWASLGNLLPLIAEAAPGEFLKAVEDTLQQRPCPFDNIFAQEGSGVAGWNYLTGLLWALETLAWEETFLIRVSVIFGELANRDPGGNWTNRPSNSLRTILLPWHPQTIATIEKRKIVVQTLEKEFPDVAWKLLLSLLPNQHQMSAGTHKPVWRNSIPKEWTGKVSNKEYWEQVSFYAAFAVEKAKDNVDRLNALIRNLDNLSKPAFDTLLTYLSSDFITEKPEDTRVCLWTGLIEFTAKHKRLSDTEWALDSSLIAIIDEVASKLEPRNLLNLYARLFNGRGLNLYKKNGDWQEQQKQVEERRQQALKLILDYGGIDAVISFLNRVDSPSNVGNSLGGIADALIDAKILPTYLDSNEKRLQPFTGAYVWSRYCHNGWDWVDNTIAKNWSKSQIACFHTFLPFTLDTWQRVSSILSDSESLYWKQTGINPYQSDCELNFAIDKLIKYGRPHAAIDCIYKGIHDKKPLDTPTIVNALISAISSQEPSQSMDTYHITEIIKALQDNNTTTSDDLFRVEWAYLPLLDGHYDATPKYLENRLATDSTFFCEVIRLVYRSKHTPKTEQEPTEQEKTIATNAWRLLHEWRTPPGIQANGYFDGIHFEKWLKETWNVCNETGHLEVALSHIGKVLLYCPADPCGLWINKAAAEVLNRKDAEKMRDGLCLAIFNSRGVHAVDPTGKPEKELAQKYRQQANETENVGFHRLAASLRGLADSYDREANRIIDEYNFEGEA